MTRDELGKAADIPLSELDAVEAGMLPISAEAMRDLCHTLNVDPSDLFDGLVFPGLQDTLGTSLFDQLLSSRRQGRSLRDHG